MDDSHAPQRIWGHTGTSDQPYGVQSPHFDGALSDEEVWDAYVHTQGALMGVAEGTPLPDREAGQTVAEVIAARTWAFAAGRGVDLGWADTDRITRLHQYNVVPNTTLPTNADHLTVMCSRPRDADPAPAPAPAPDKGELVMFPMTRMAPGAPRTKPADVRVTAETAEPGVVLTQDIRVLPGVQRRHASAGLDPSGSLR